METRMHYKGINIILEIHFYRLAFNIHAEKFNSVRCAVKSCCWVIMSTEQDPVRGARSRALESDV